MPQSNKEPNQKLCSMTVVFAWLALGSHVFLRLEWTSQTKMLSLQFALTPPKQITLAVLVVEPSKVLLLIEIPYPKGGYTLLLARRSPNKILLTSL